MFGSLRSKFLIVQDGLSTSLRGFSISESSQARRFLYEEKVNYGAGADILHHFQLQWNELHELAEENAAKAREVDILIGGVYERLDGQWGSINMLNGTLAAIPKINKDIQKLMDQIGSLEEAFEEVEAALYRLEDLNETLELQHRQLDHRFQLALYKEKKLAELDSVRAELAMEHEQRVFQQDLKQRKSMKERQEAFEEVSRSELENYKVTGSVPQITSSHKGPSLEEICLEADSTDFDKFLKS